MATKAKKEKEKPSKATTTRTLDAFRGREDKELKFETEKLRKEFFDITFKAVAEGTKNPSRLGVIRKQIARIETVLSERRHGIRGQASR